MEISKNQKKVSIEILYKNTCEIDSYLSDDSYNNTTEKQTDDESIKTYIKNEDNNEDFNSLINEIYDEENYIDRSTNQSKELNKLNLENEGQLDTILEKSEKPLETNLHEKILAETEIQKPLSGPSIGTTNNNNHDLNEKNKVIKDEIAQNKIKPENLGKSEIPSSEETKLKEGIKTEKISKATETQIPSSPASTENTIKIKHEINVENNEIKNDIDQNKINPESVEKTKILHSADTKFTEGINTEKEFDHTRVQIPSSPPSAENSNNFKHDLKVDNNERKNEIVQNKINSDSVEKSKILPVAEAEFPEGLKTEKVLKEIENKKPSIPPYTKSINKIKHDLTEENNQRKIENMQNEINAEKSKKSEILPPEEEKLSEGKKTEKILDESEIQKPSSQPSTQYTNNINHDLNVEINERQNVIARNKINSESVEKSEILSPAETNFPERLKTEKDSIQTTNNIKNDISADKKGKKHRITQNKINQKKQIEIQHEESLEEKNTVDSHNSQKIDDNLHSEVLSEIQNDENKRRNDDLTHEDKNFSSQIQDKIKPIDNYKINEDIENNSYKEMNENHRSQPHDKEMKMTLSYFYLSKIENYYKEIQKVFLYYLTICHSNVAKFLLYPYDLLFFLLVGYFIGKLIIFPKKKSNIQIYNLLSNFRD